ncbi:MAG: hypothetical protein UZ04_CHB001000841 [Chlorobi bacterium OLB4]|jgi:Orthopoxvirus protein of unknown function (DUF830).|nr:MAG: hypothetical protein UZ04_CHB001000841 [Chlorobi bacterium OLB4]MBW7855650.1 hypothetical protein [Ignavibacteria bacterium]
MSKTPSEKIFIVLLFAVTVLGLWASFTLLKRTFYDPIHLKSIAPDIVMDMTKSNLLSEGDIVFQSKKVRTNDLMSYLNDSSIDQVGIILYYRKGYYVLESDGEVVLTPLEEWIPKGENGNFTVKRLRNVKIKGDRLLNEALKFTGKNKDIYFNWSDDLLYNAELVYKVIEDATGVKLGALKQLDEFSFDKKGKELLRQTYGDNIPFKDNFITVKQLYDSDELETIYNY